ncbi:MAG: alcohol dehydrogenase catalytic domain-containing protein [Deltaproteobacteria bacterium]|nr:alcohol dehydrogenase catalytic domain-containing protein [Deltaproteobacteria bacterium]
MKGLPMDTMAAAIFDGALRYANDIPIPEPKPGWARIRVRLAGICKTDMEIIRGYKGFKGILGHEFVGHVDRCDNPAWTGRRVVGEINAACGTCGWCAQGLGRHCPDRTTLGIDRLDGCMAEFCVIPAENLFAVPEEITDERAVLIEPLAAACEILEQLPLRGTERVVVLGDGRLGILCAWVLATAAAEVTLLGRHPEKLARAPWRGIRTAVNPRDVKPGADIVVEATGSGQGIVEAMGLCRPRGTIVLKSTVAIPGKVNLVPIVVNEQTILGSRCGRFGDGLAMMRRFPDMPLERLVACRYPLERVEEAFARAREGDALKILLEMAP